MHNQPNYNHRNVKIELSFKDSNAIKINLSVGDGLSLKLDNVQLIFETTHFLHIKMSVLDNIHMTKKNFRYFYYNK